MRNSSSCEKDSYLTPSIHESDLETVDNDEVEADKYEYKTNVDEITKFYNEKIQKLLKKMEDEEIDEEKREEINKKVFYLRKELSGEIEEVKKSFEGKKETSTLQWEEKCEYKTFAINENINDFLYEHQRKGLHWMLDLFFKNKGGILADEMGMGKSIMVLSYVHTLISNETGYKKFLILCPATVVHVWQDEYKKLSKISDFDIFNLKTNFDTNIKMSNKPCLYVFSYMNFLSKNKDFVFVDKEVIDENINNGMMEFDCVFLDEGHKIKNKESKITRLCKNINSKINFIVSGTPIQNDLIELWTIVDFVLRGYLGSVDDFKRDFVGPIVEKTNGDLSYTTSMLLKEMIDPYILQRTKQDIQHTLPKKLDKVIFCTMTKEQTEKYLKGIEMYNMSSQKITSEKLFKTIDHLRKICNHVFLLKNDYNEWTKDELLKGSCKMSVMMKKIMFWLEERKNGYFNKILIFTQTVQMQKIIELLFLHVNTFKWFTLNGKTPQKDRKILIDRFNKDSDVFVFLLTTKVGGLGVNLTGANKIVIYDPDWNPSTDSQAKERIYRYGQKRDVEIFRLVCRNTVEEKIYQKQIYKECLGKRILKNPKTFIQKASIDLFSYSRPLANEEEESFDKNY
ncbi:RAD26 [Ecytonucleospora hepatopenaei]|uniref:RAD26 n=1 Tax=Ecytonucleospora hepatopenaei TaxID=646526 RepID=A0A1W0E6T9_9MICR|nr:RAD26 [Ecytonucleospora hepatopenaei]